MKFVSGVTILTAMVSEILSGLALLFPLLQSPESHALSLRSYGNGDAPCYPLCTS